MMRRLFKLWVVGVCLTSIIICDTSSHSDTDDTSSDSDTDGSYESDIERATERDKNSQCIKSFKAIKVKKPKSEEDAEYTCKFSSPNKSDLERAAEREKYREKLRSFKHISDIEMPEPDSTASGTDTVSSQPNALSDPENVSILPCALSDANTCSTIPYPLSDPDTSSIQSHSLSDPESATALPYALSDSDTSSTEPYALSGPSISRFLDVGIRGVRQRRTLLWVRKHARRNA